ncbi:hypothetical protein CDAR_167631 [Caerostris darwini]|uniref:Uncharacterized protein n=1 Tax=Caerostris darwini TaxID=1538125 RepID=A0AAV4M7V4_9ARAC|nr:hypothetical protein CDAR_167631 [Caerostris darwini]
MHTENICCKPFIILHLLISSATESVINSYSQFSAIKSVLPDTIKSVSVDASNPPPNTQGALPFKGVLQDPRRTGFNSMPPIPKSLLHRSLWSRAYRTHLGLCTRGWCSFKYYQFKILD